MAALANFLTTMWCGPSADLFDFLPFCGQRIGEGLVMKLLGHDSPTLLSRRHAKTMLVDGDRAAVLGRLTATRAVRGSVIASLSSVSSATKRSRLRVDHRQLRC